MISFKILQQWFVQQDIFLLSHTTLTNVLYIWLEKMQVINQY